MKHLKAFIMSMFLIASLQAQVINIPKQSKEHFAKKYPDAQEVDWHNNLADYQVKFRNKEGVHRAYYHLDGHWDFTELYIDNSKIPAAVKSSLSKSRFSDWTMESSALVENNKGQKLYRLEMKKGIEKKNVFYDKTGKEVKTAVTK